jgi:NADH-quinone oxidoreductase subunit C
MTAADLAQSLAKAFPEATKLQPEFRGEHTLEVRLSDLLAVLQHCRDALGFDSLVDLSTVDHETRLPRFDVVYELYGMEHHQHLRLRVLLADEEECPSACEIWPTANWHEREAYDMMGVRFANHPDLRRILLWEGFPHFPLRKEYPLAGLPTELPEVAFTRPAPMADGPFVTSAGGKDAIAREPRARPQRS